MEQAFPRLVGTSFEITSPATPDYNCIAWAAGDTARWWEPNSDYYWPEGATRSYTLDAYTQAYGTCGFETCDVHAFEEGWEKVAIFTDDKGVPMHAARQRTDGTWTSKLGKLEDITHHEVGDVGGGLYGEPALILRRRRP